jgi:hypothetical protein
VEKNRPEAKTCQHLNGWMLAACRIFASFFLQSDVVTGIIRLVLERLYRMDEKQHQEEELVKTTVRIPEWVYDGLKVAGKLHRRNFNNELVVALEEYLKNYKNVL